MKAIYLALLLVFVVAATAAPAPDNDDYYDYDYGSYEDDDDDDDNDDDYRLPSSMFKDLRPRPAPAGGQQPSACSWAVVHCCSIADRMGARNDCFSRLGCSGAWFVDICTRSIQRSIFKSVLNTLRAN